MFIGCETQAPIDTFTDAEYTLLAYDQILINYNIDQQKKDSLYSILFSTYSVSKHKMDSLKSVLVEKSPFYPALLDRVKAEIDSINNSNATFNIKP